MNFAIRGFSLVEVVMALGIVSCSLLMILALLPLGLQRLHDSSVQYGITAIGQQISGELQGMPFTPSTSNPDYAITKLGGRPAEFFTREGAQTTGVDEDRYFAVSFSTTNPIIPGATTTYPASAQTVRAEITYPVSAPVAARQSHVLTFLSARQNNL